MKALAENQVVLLGITFILYYGVLLLQKKYNSVFLNPVLITVLVLVSYLIIFGISPEKYEEAGQYIDFWLKPSIVALGVPLYLQLSKIKKQLIPLVVSQFAGSLVGIITVCLTAKWLGLSNDSHFFSTKIGNNSYCIRSIACASRHRTYHRDGSDDYGLFGEYFWNYFSQLVSYQESDGKRNFLRYSFSRIGYNGSV